MLLVPHCAECSTPVVGDDGREVTVEARLLTAEHRRRLTATGWDVVPGDPKVNRGITDPFGADRLTCPVCTAARQAVAAAAVRRLVRDLARPRIRSLGMADRLGHGWTLSQREGDDDIRRWLVEYEGTVHGSVNRYRRTTGALSAGWEAHRLSGSTFVRVDAISACQHRPGSSFLWSARDLAAWGVAVRPAYDAPPPARVGDPHPGEGEHAMTMSDQTGASTNVRPVVTPTLVLPGPAGGAPAQFSPDVLAKLQELEDRSKKHEQAMRPTNTVDSYAADWKQWTQFCALLELLVTAITPGSLTAFVEWLWWQPTRRRRRAGQHRRRRVAHHRVAAHR